MSPKSHFALRPLHALSIALAGAAFAATGTAMAQPNMTEGNWEITMKMEMAGMPFAMPPQTLNRCITKNDVVPDMSRPGEQCTVRDQKVAGDTVTWRVQCKGRQGTMDGEGRVKYSGKSYDGTMQAKITETSGQAMTMNYTFQGRHTGPCKAEASKKKAGDY